MGNASMVQEIEETREIKEIHEIRETSEAKENKEAKNSCAIIIFGATGDLTKRKLIPALYQMYQKGTINDNFPILGIGRRQIDKDQFISLLEIDKFIPDREEKVLSQFLELISYFRLDLTEDISGSDLSHFLNHLKNKHKCSNNKIFYLAIPSNLFENAVSKLQSSKLLESGGWSRLVFEKPFGHDLSSAKELNRLVTSVFKEEQIYRIDHYLAKELVQSIIAFRFANSIFELEWNAKCIDNVQITVAESIGIEGRGRYYDKAGAIRDMLQNHILQILSLVAMEEPKSLDADSIRDEKVRVLKSLKPVKAEDLVVGQYDGGFIGASKVNPYRMEPNVDLDSMTETYVAARIHLDNQRWSGVPFYVRTGKRLQKHYSEINLVMKDIPSRLFSQEYLHYNPNILTIRIQPDEGLVLVLNTKYPGREFKLHPVIMDFCHKCEFAINSPTAYETLLTQILMGDQTLFNRWDGIETSWEFTDPLVALAKEQNYRFPNYEAGSSGPKEADELPAKDGRQWVSPKEIIHENHEHKIYQQQT